MRLKTLPVAADSEAGCVQDVTTSEGLSDYLTRTNRGLFLFLLLARTLNLTNNMCNIQPEARTNRIAPETFGGGSIL